MVKFNKASFTIEVETTGNPIEEWLALHNELIDCLQSEEESMVHKRYQYLELVRSIMPDWETCKKMTDNK